METKADPESAPGQSTRLALSVSEVCRPFVDLCKQLNRTPTVVAGDVFDVVVRRNRVTLTVVSRSAPGFGYPCHQMRVVHQLDHLDHWLPRDLYRTLNDVADAKGDFGDRPWPVVEITGRFDLDAFSGAPMIWSDEITLTRRRSEAGRWFEAQRNAIGDLKTRELPEFFIPSNGVFIGRESTKAYTDVTKNGPRRQRLKTAEVGMGPKNVGDLIEKLQHFEADAHDYVVVARGGGGQADLFGFCDARLVEAVTAVPVPCLVAIGHAEDKPLVGHGGVALDTPTDVGKRIGKSLIQAKEKLDAARTALDETEAKTKDAQDKLAQDRQATFGTASARARVVVRRRRIVATMIALITGGTIGWMMQRSLGAALTGALIASIVSSIALLVVARRSPPVSAIDTTVDLASTVETAEVASDRAFDRTSQLRWQTRELDALSIHHERTCEHIREATGVVDQTQLGRSDLLDYQSMMAIVTESNQATNLDRRLSLLATGRRLLQHLEGRLESAGARKSALPTES